MGSLTLGAEIFGRLTFGSVNADGGALPTSIAAGRASMVRCGSDNDRRSN
ncbi:MAG TPA: hypothetical protein VJK02_16595 [Anaerolineales bacterium]|nr:hypothetical protein [Anaerolineales bacterium]